MWFNTLRPRQNGRHFADDTFKHIFMNENVRISINISLKFVPKVLINNIPALVQIMAWRRPGDKPLSEPMMVNLLTHICVTRPQWVEGNPSTHWFLSGVAWIYNGHMKSFRGNLDTQSNDISRDLVAHFQWVNLIQNVKQNHWKPQKLWRKYIQICDHHCTCQWPSTVRCQDICRHSDDQIQGPDSI